jgi:hypothetical protein
MPCPGGVERCADCNIPPESCGVSGRSTPVEGGAAQVQGFYESLAATVFLQGDRSGVLSPTMSRRAENTLRQAGALPKVKVPGLGD